MTQRMEALRHELLSDLANHTATLLMDYGIDSEIAEQAGFALADHMADHWGGQLLFFPKDIPYKLAKRDLKIWEEFNGHNHKQLADKYQIRIRTIYKIIRKVKKQQLALNQSDLFDSQN